MIGARIKEHRQARKWSREKLAEIIGVAPGTIFRWESGKFFPSTIYRQALAKAFGVPLGRLVNVDSGPCTLEDALKVIQAIAERNKELEAVIEAIGPGIADRLAKATPAQRDAILKILR